MRKTGYNAGPMKTSRALLRMLVCIVLGLLCALLAGCASSCKGYEYPEITGDPADDGLWFYRNSRRTLSNFDGEEIFEIPELEVDGVVYPYISIGDTYYSGDDVYMALSYADDNTPARTYPYCIGRYNLQTKETVCIMSVGDYELSSIHYVSEDGDRIFCYSGYSATYSRHTYLMCTVSTGSIEEITDKDGNRLSFAYTSQYVAFSGYNEDGDYEVRVRSWDKGSEAATVFTAPKGNVSKWWLSGDYVRAVMLDDAGAYNLISYSIETGDETCFFTPGTKAITGGAYADGSTYCFIQWDITAVSVEGSTENATDTDEALSYAYTSPELCSIDIEDLSCSILCTLPEEVTGFYSLASSPVNGHYIDLEGTKTDEDGSSSTVYYHYDITAGELGEGLQEQTIVAEYGDYVFYEAQDYIPSIYLGTNVYILHRYNYSTGVDDVMAYRTGTYNTYVGCVTAVRPY